MYGLAQYDMKGGCMYRIAQYDMNVRGTPRYAKRRRTGDTKKEKTAWMA